MKQAIAHNYIGIWLEIVLVLQVFTTLFILWKTVATETSGIFYNGVPIPIELYCALVVIQCSVVTYLLFSIENDPEGWKALIILLSILFISNIAFLWTDGNKYISVNLGRIHWVLAIFCVVVICKTYQCKKVLAQINILNDQNEC